MRTASTGEAERPRIRRRARLKTPRQFLPVEACVEPSVSRCLRKSSRCWRSAGSGIQCKWQFTDPRAYCCRPQVCPVGKMNNEQAMPAATYRSSRLAIRLQSPSASPVGSAWVAVEVLPSTGRMTTCGIRAEPVAVVIRADLSVWSSLRSSARPPDTGYSVTSDSILNRRTAAAFLRLD